MSQLTNTKLAPKLYLAGNLVDTNDRFDVINPYDGSIVGSAPCASQTQIESALVSADTYAKSPLIETERSQLLENWAEVISHNVENLSVLLTKENGKPIKQSRVEVMRAIETMKTYAVACYNLNSSASELIAKLESGEDMSCMVNSEGYFETCLHQPLGVVTAYTPFNFPVNTLVHKISAAVAAGNSIVVKPSEKTPLVALELARLLSAVPAPDGLLSVLSGHHQDFTELFLTHPQVDFFSMTGNSDVGRKLYQDFANAKPFKKCHFELGGNAPQIVLADFEVESAANLLTTAVFDHNGSRCTTPRKILVPEGDYAKSFYEAVAAKANLWKTGDPLHEDTQLGALIDTNAAVMVEKRINDAIRKGAKLLYGGRRNGAIMEATALRDVTPDMQIFKEENFGPVMSILTYDSLDHAMKVANAGEFGLQPAVMTTDMNKGLQVAKALRAGCINIGSATTSFRSDSTPFGGIGSSGIGKEGGRAGIIEMCNTIPYKFYPN